MRKNNRSTTSSNSSETKPQTATRTNWERLDALSDEEIDTLDPVHAVMIEVAVDEDILAWFQSQGQDYQQRIQP